MGSGSNVPEASLGSDLLRTEHLKLLTEVLCAPNITAVGRFPFS